MIADHRKPVAGTTNRNRLEISYVVFSTGQIWLALFYFGASYAKLSEPFDSLVLLLSWPSLFPSPILRWIGAVEGFLAIVVLASLNRGPVGQAAWRLSTGLLLPSQAIAAAYHLTIRDYGLALTNVFLIALVTASFFGRASRCPAPIS